MSGVLAGTRVLELGGKGPTPFAGMLLADMGADVLAIRRRDAPAQADASVLDRGKSVLSADLKDAAVRDALIGTIRGMDVVIEGFRPGVTERLGLGPAELCGAHPGLVYGRMSGYGRTGPLAHTPGHDINFVAMSSALGAMGRAGEPPTVPLNLVGDFGGGGMLLVVGVLGALVERARSRRGQVVDAAMVDGAALLMASIYGMRAAGAWSDERGENEIDGAAPFYRAYETADGRYVSVGALDPRHYAELARVCGIADPPEQHDRASWPALTRRFEDAFRAKDRAHWESAFTGRETSFAPVLSPAEAPEHPQHRARASFVHVDGVVQPAPAPRFSRSPSSVSVRRGVGAAEALARLGVPEPEASALVRRGVVG